MTAPHETLGVGVIGCGPWGSNHVRVWAQLGHLRAVADADHERAERAAASVQLAEAVSIDEMLGRPDITALVVATPAATHAELALRALEGGKDVLVEKPLALSVAEGEELAAAADKHGAVLMVDHLLEYHPAVLRLRELIAAGTLGRVRYVYSQRLNFGRVRTEENALWSFAPHDVGLLHTFLGEPLAVSCHGAGYLNHKVADVTVMTLEFPDDVRAHVFVSWLHPFKEHRFVVIGEQEMVVFDDTAPWPEKLIRYPHRVDWVDGRLPVASKADAVTEPLEECEPLVAACQHFVDCVRDRRPPRTGAASGLAVLRILNAGDRSLLDSGKPVRARDLEPEVFVHPSATVDAGADLGPGTRVWHYTHVSTGAKLGHDCVLGQNVFVGRDTRIGNSVKIQNNVSVYEGVELEDDVFCGPSAVFTNVLNPRADVERKDEFRPTLVRTGATIGANATVVCGNTIGRYAMVGAGAVVTHDVVDHALVVGAPARRVGWVSHAGEILGPDLECPRTGRRYHEVAGTLEEMSG